MGSQGGLSGHRVDQIDGADGVGMDDDDQGVDGLAGGLMGMDDDDIDAVEDEVIDIAEQIFVKIAHQVVKQGIRNIREVFIDNIYETEIEGQTIEILHPVGLLDGIKELGINDLTEKEIACLLRVLTKPELDQAILVDEFLQIMENLGLYDDEDQLDASGTTSNVNAKQ